MISYSRGQIHIENIERVRENACECHEALGSNYDRIFGAGSGPHWIVPPCGQNSIIAR
jgi:hypothetical protein